MISKTNLATDDRVVLDDGTACNPSLGRDDDASSDSDIVANLYQVVDLAPLADLSGTQRPSVDSCTGADLDIRFYQHVADLRKLDLRRSVQNVAETIAAHDHSCVKHNSIFQACFRIQHDSGMKNALLSNDASLSNHHSRMEDRFLSDTCSSLHGDVRTDVHI